VQRRQIDLLSIDELVVGRGPQIVNVVDEEGVGWFVASQENDLGAPRSEGLGNGGADTRGATLGDVSIGNWV